MTKEVKSVWNKNIPIINETVGDSIKGLALVSFGCAVLGGMLLQSGSNFLQVPSGLIAGGVMGLTVSAVSGGYLYTYQKFKSLADKLALKL